MYKKTWETQLDKFFYLLPLIINKHFLFEFKVSGDNDEKEVKILAWQRQWNNNNRINTYFGT